MKKLILIAICISVYTVFANSQYPAPKILSIVTLGDGSHVMTKDLILGPKEIASGSILTKSEIDKNYKSENADIVIKIVPKPGILFLNLNELLDIYKVNPKFRKYSILFQDSIVHDPNTLMASKSYVRGIKIDKNKKTLNILTIDYEKSIAFRRLSQIHKEPVNRIVTSPPIHNN